MESAPPLWFTNASLGGPPVGYEEAASWVERPFQDGVVLVGDAAGASDPSWGCGLFLTLRDVRVLRDCLSGTSTSETAARRYAAERDTYFHALHTVESWLTTIVYPVSAAEERTGAYASPLLAAGQSPTMVGVGPDTPVDDGRRIRLFGV